MPNPMIAQGTLNRLRGSVVWPSFSALNVTSPYLTKAGMRWSPQGDAVTYIPTMTGAVTSPEPYLMFDLLINLNKANGLAQQYKAQLEYNAMLANGTLRPDTTALAPFSLVNCSIKTVRELDLSGEDAGFAVVIGGYYLVNSNLFDLT
jgi:hypothetical protein